MYRDNLWNIPDGTFILIDGKPYLIANKLMYLWSPFGYDKGIDLPKMKEVTVLTPKSAVKAFRAGYKAQMAIDRNFN